MTISAILHFFLSYRFTHSPIQFVLVTSETLVFSVLGCLLRVVCVCLYAPNNSHRTCKSFRNRFRNSISLFQKMEKKVDENATLMNGVDVNAPKDDQPETFMQFLYNKKNGTVLGRTGKSWFQVSLNLKSSGPPEEV